MTSPATRYDARPRTLEQGSAPPLVSLIMPVWKPHPSWFAEAVQTALGQRGCRIELLAVDDGCPEPVDALLAEIDDARLRVLRVPHGGGYRARNAGLAAARGDFVRFVDSDDVFDPWSTARLLELAVREPGTISYGATMFCDESLRPVWRMASRLRGHVAVDCLLSRFSVRPPSMLFPRAVVEATGEWEPAFRVSGDWDWVLRALEHAPVRGEKQVACYYRRHPASVTADIRAGEEGAERVAKRYFERHPEKLGTSLERQTQAMLHARSFRVCATHGRRRESLRRLGEALLVDPRAFGNELTQAGPALWGRLRWASSPPPPVSTWAAVAETSVGTKPPG